MAKSSPTPWRVSHGYIILDADGVSIAHAVRCPDAEYLVEAVNYYEVLIQERRRLIGELDSVKAQLDWHKRQLKAVKSDAESQERWANQYFEQAQAAEAENARLRDLVRKLLPFVECVHAHTNAMIEYRRRFGMSADDTYTEMDRLSDDIIAEAREAIGEAQG